MKPLTLVLTLLTTACGSTPLTPTPAAPVTVQLPVALAGQSNADFLRPYLVTAYAPNQVTGFAQGGSFIREWADGTPFWKALAPSLQAPLRAFVWWQGESDYRDPTAFLDDSRAFLAHVRREANNPSLLVVICRVVDDANFITVRALQEVLVAADPHAVLVSSDDLPLEGPRSAHLNAEGYRLMAGRIMAALPR